MKLKSKTSRKREREGRRKGEREGEISRETETGRYYTVKKKFLLENFDELMNE